MNRKLWKNAGVALILGSCWYTTGCGDTATTDLNTPKPTVTPTPSPAPEETPAAPTSETRAPMNTPAEQPSLAAEAPDAPGHTQALDAKPAAHSMPATAAAFDATPLVALVKPILASTVAPLPDEDSIYWQPPDTSLIQDEPLEVKVPRGLPDLTPNVVVPESNPITKGKFELGRLLYFDPRVSKDGMVSCATCHDPSSGWSKATPKAIGIAGQVGGRNSPTVTNTVYGKSMFWDGRAPSLEAQSQGPPQNPIEMGEQTYEEIVARLRDVPEYQERFRRVFGTQVTLDGVSKAIATFERVAGLSGDSAYDRYRDFDDPEHNSALTESEKRGMVLFGERLNDDEEFTTDVVLQKAKCTLCHQGFNFTDEKFHNLGVGFDPATGKFADYGRFMATAIGAKNPADIGAFKTPTVRDVTRSGPYMHDGSQATLEEVVEHYNKGGIANPYLDQDMKPLNLTDAEKADVVAFMKALTGKVEELEIPTLPANSDGSVPDAKAAMAIPKKKLASGDVHLNVPRR